MIQPLTTSNPQLCQMAQYVPMNQSSYQSQAIPQNNAVKIDIHNPYASNQPAYSPYAMPQASAYAPYATANTACMMPVYTPQVLPQMLPQMLPAPISMPAAPAVMQAPVMQPQTVNTNATATASTTTATATAQSIPPTPVVTPVITPVVTPVIPQAAPTPAVTTTQTQATAQAQTQSQTTAPAQVQPIIVPPSVVVPQPVITNQPQIINAPQTPVAIPVPPVAVPVTNTPIPVAQTIPAEPVQANAEVIASAPQATATATATATAPAPQVEAPAATPVNVDLNQIISKLHSTNPETQLNAIETIAETAESNPTAATQLLDTQIMDALATIIKRDTTQMQAPTPEQLKLRQKLISGEVLTPEQTEAANQISEMEIAERNKQFALYTVAILQKLLSTEVEKAQGTKLEMKDLPMITDVIKIAKNDVNPMLRASALAALSYIATPENKPLLTTMFEQSTKDADPNVQAVAAEALNKLSQI